MTRKRVKELQEYVVRHWKKIVGIAAASIAVLLVLVQIFYPTTSLLPNTRVGSVALGAISKEEAVKKLDSVYAHTKVPVYFSDSKEVVVEPTYADLGVTVKNKSRVAAYDYPFAWRLVPSSLFWYQVFMGKGEPAVERNADTFASYMLNRFGDDCEFEPSNGTIAFIDNSLQVVDAARGGSCDIDALTSKLKDVSVRLNPADIKVEGSSRAPEISTDVAKAEHKRLVKKLGDGLKLKVEDKDEKVALSTVSSWVEYSVQDGALVLGLNAEAAGSWLQNTYAERFTNEPGTTVISTRDFAEVSRETGKSGQALNVAGTIESAVNYLKAGEKTAEKAKEATLVIEKTDPKVTYKRSYSSTNAGLSAVMKNYADTHPGTYGVKLVELSGARRNAEFNSKTQFTTASTYKLFVAYSVLLRIERGEMHWTDTSYGGQSTSVCFNKMIELSNNECSIDFLYKVGFAGVTNDAHAIGATSTSFLGGNGIKSTASDEALLLSLLYSGQILSQQSSRDRLIEAMKGNVYRLGIPSGIPSATVADKVGFLDALLHDAAIVYSPKGAYVLIILTDNASWGNIAELAKEIEAVR